MVEEEEEVLGHLYILVETISIKYDKSFRKKNTLGVASLFLLECDAKLSFGSGHRADQS